MIGCVSAERTNSWTCNMGSDPVGECAMRSIRFVATADGKLGTVRRLSRASFVLRKQCFRISERKLAVPTGVITGGRGSRTAIAGGRVQGAAK
jgi:hypothetical protein